MSLFVGTDIVGRDARTGALSLGKRLTARDDRVRMPLSQSGSGRFRASPRRAGR